MSQLFKGVLTIPLREVVVILSQLQFSLEKEYFQNHENIEKVKII